MEEAKDTGKSKKTEPGVVYLSRIPPTMTPHELRVFLEPFGKIGRMHLVPDAKTMQNGRLKSGDFREHRKARYTEGWVEFLRRKDAKTVALALNGSLVGGKRRNRFHDDLWNIKYLPDFSWANLTEQTSYERAVRAQKLRNEITQARRANNLYMRQAEKARVLDKIEEKRTARRAKEEGLPVEAITDASTLDGKMQVLRERLRQRKPISIGENA